MLLKILSACRWRLINDQPENQPCRNRADSISRTWGKLEKIQEWLGHSNISATANIYTHMDFNKKISSANVIIGLLSKEKESTSAATESVDSLKKCW